MLLLLRALAVSAALVAALVATGPAVAVGPDYPSLLGSALVSNAQLVGLIRSTPAEGALDALKIQSGAALGTAEEVQGLLSQALVLAPDDLSRSRVEGIVRHINAAVDPLRLATEETTVDATRGRLSQAGAEAEEALSAFASYASTLPPPQSDVLPRSGGLDAAAVAAATAFGLGLCPSGMALPEAGSGRLPWLAALVAACQARAQTDEKSPATSTSGAL